MAGCYGGPMFNLLMGFGLAHIYLTLKHVSYSRVWVSPHCVLIPPVHVSEVNLLLTTRVSFIVNFVFLKFKGPQPLVLGNAEIISLVFLLLNLVSTTVGPSMKSIVCAIPDIDFAPFLRS
jgi:hypothetical protein